MSKVARGRILVLFAATLHACIQNIYHKNAEIQSILLILYKVRKRVGGGGVDVNVKSMYDIRVRICMRTHTNCVHNIHTKRV